MSPGATTLIALLTALPGAASSEPAVLVSLLRLAGDYVLGYEKLASGVVLEEASRQSLRRGASQETRLLLSDFVLVALTGHDLQEDLPEAGIFGFRDVYKVDGEAVRDREARLERLFLRPSREGLEQVREILDEGARYNLGRTERNFNFPTMALIVLRPQVQGRFVFRDKGSRTVRGRPSRRVEFEEKSRPTLVRDPVRDEDQFSRGAFVLEVETGVVLRSEFRVEERRGSSSVEVEYRWDQGLQLWLPYEMDESYETAGGGFVIAGSRTRVSAGEILTARARYSRPRRFGVTTEEAIRPPEPDPHPPSANPGPPPG